MLEKSYVGALASKSRFASEILLWYSTALQWRTVQGKFAIWGLSVNQSAWFDQSEVFLAEEGITG
jgi:hypothetical protein